MRWMGLLPALVLLAACGEDARPPPPASPLGRTDVVLHTGAPIRPGRNVLWCATIQLAWDEAAQVVAPTIGRAALPLGPPAPAADVDAMNARPFPRDALDSRSYVALAGFARDGISDRIRAAIRERFGPDSPAPEIPAGNGPDLLAFAMLIKDAPFQKPFRVHPEALSFAGGPARVRAFGIARDDHSPMAQDLASQVRYYYAAEGASKEERAAVKDHPVAELLTRDGKDRILLAAVPAGATLEATWEAARRRIETAERRESVVALVVPTIRLDLTHSFSQLEGSPITGVRDSSVKAVEQVVRFELTESGARLQSHASLRLATGGPPQLRFDGPFLLALLQTGATQPYFLLWLGNDDLLARFTVSQPDARTLANVTGDWVLERERTRDVYAAADADDAQTQFYGKDKSRAELLEYGRRDWDQVVGLKEASAHLDADGRGATVATMKEGRGSRVTGALRIEDGVLVLVGRDELDSQHPEAEQRFTVQRQGEFLVIAPAGGANLGVVYRRK